MKINIYESHTLLKNKKISSTELVKEALKNANASKTNSFITLTDDRALYEAKVADEEISKDGLKSWLHGVPFSLKDLFITKNIRTTAGSHILFNYIPPYDGFISKRLASDGGILVGKVSCDEFGMGSTNENTPYGTVSNPFDAERVAGGSSGGSAASVAEDSCAYSIGTDTGGSIRLPANFCGLVGFKPTYGRVSRYGQIAYGSSLDQAGPITKNVLDAGCVLESITEKDILDVTNVPNKKVSIVEDLIKIDATYLKGKVVAYSRDFIESCDSDVRSSLNDALKLLEKAGAKLVETSFPHFKYSVAAYYLIATSEASTNLARYDGIHFGLRDKSSKGSLEQTYVRSRTLGFGEEVRKRVILGTFSLSSGYQDEYFAKACRVRRKINNDFNAAFAKADVIFAPVCGSLAFKHGESKRDPIKMYMNDLYTIPVNLAGLPGLALPYGKHGKLPTGFQFIGKAFEDEELLKIGRAFELAAENKG
jgi:aspartyl-tRNA(Asn)/glutamyl-tRNA(Gln) amidotransferase subunit A